MSEKEPSLPPLSPSVTCLHLEEAAKSFVTQLDYALRDLHEQRTQMIAENVSRSDPRFVSYEKEWRAILAVVDGMAKANLTAWDVLNCKPLTAAP